MIIANFHLKNESRSRRILFIFEAGISSENFLSDSKLRTLEHHFCETYVNLILLVLENFLSPLAALENSMWPHCSHFSPII